MERSRAMASVIRSGGDQPSKASRKKGMYESAMAPSDSVPAQPINFFVDPFEHGRLHKKDFHAMLPVKVGRAPGRWVGR